MSSDTCDFKTGQRVYYRRRHEWGTFVVADGVTSLVTFDADPADAGTRVATAELQTTSDND